MGCSVAYRAAFDLSCNEEIEWLSPLADDAYAEYRDEAFLDRLGIVNASSSLRSFWPNKGPQWDGLARTKSGMYILVEAKAYADEAKSTCTATASASLRKIAESLAKTQAHFGVSKEICWQHPYYQYANRLAHLYFLRHVCRLDAFLLFLNFADAPDVSKPCSEDQWKLASISIEQTLGLTTGIKREGIATVVWSVRDMPGQVKCRDK